MMFAEKQAEILIWKKLSWALQVSYVLRFEWASRPNVPCVSI